MRILYLPIIEPGAFHDTALVNKRGLLDALIATGAAVQQLDYLAVPREAMQITLFAAVQDWQPDLLLTQLHGADPITPAMLQALRIAYPALTIVNWSGDSWLHSLTSPAMLELCRAFDLQLIAAPDVLPVYAEHGIRAAFWQIAYERPVGTLPTMPAYDLVFLGNVISDKRRALLEWLRTLPDLRVGIYGDWSQADGHNTYDFGAGEALYQNATLTIADCAYPDQDNYVSNRPIQALIAGGALLLHQHVPKMDQLLGLIPATHFIEWHDFGDLETAIRYWLQPAQAAQRRTIVQAGQTFALAQHTYTQRVAALFAMLPEVIRC